MTNPTENDHYVNDIWLSNLATGEDKISETPDLVGPNGYPFRINLMNDNTQIVISASDISN
ncbi:hypothetical protein [Citrobacter sp. SL156]